MDFRGREEPDFREADRRYAELKRQRDAGTMGDEEFDAQRKQLMVKDDEGRWWAKGREDSDWYYRGETGWVKGTPPGYQPLSEGPSAESAPEHRPRPGQAALSRRRRALPLVLATGFAGLALVGFIVWMLVPYPQDEDAAEEASEPAPGYQLVENDSGSLSAEVPSEWDDRYTGYDGTFEGDDVDAGEGVGPAITASTDMNAWETGGPVPGLYMVASRELAREYDEDHLVASGFNDRSTCEVGDRQDFDRPPYSGGVQRWDCEGDGSTIFTLGAAPEGRECVVMLQVKTYSEADREVARHVLDTFKADCERI